MPRLPADLLALANRSDLTRLACRVVLGDPDAGGPLALLGEDAGLPHRILRLVRGGHRYGAVMALRYVAAPNVPSSPEQLTWRRHPADCACVACRLVRALEAATG